MTSLYRLIQEFRDGTAAMDWEAWAEDVVASIDQRAAMADPGEHAPCPFCGSTNISSGDVLSGQMGDYAKQTSCLDCGANGPEVKMSLAMAQHADGDALADAAWNSRKPVCSACGDTGDIHDLTGQYLGGCDLCEAAALGAVTVAETIPPLGSATERNDCLACHGSGRGNLLDVCGRCNGTGAAEVRASDGDGSRSGREWWEQCNRGTQ